MTAHHQVKLTASFERNLDEIEVFLRESEAPPQVFDALLDALSDTVVPNLERFPAMGKSFLERSIRSVETSNALARLVAQCNALGQDAEVREVGMADYLLLYALIDGTVYLLSIRHHRQVSFDFMRHWPD